MCYLERALGNDEFPKEEVAIYAQADTCACDSARDSPKDSELDDFGTHKDMLQKTRNQTTSDLISPLPKERSYGKRRNGADKRPKEERKDQVLVVGDFVILECDCSPSVDYEVVYVVWSVVSIGTTTLVGLLSDYLSAPRFLYHTRHYPVPGMIVMHSRGSFGPVPSRARGTAQSSYRYACESSTRVLVLAFYSSL